MHDQNLIESTALAMVSQVEPREQIERELTALVVTLVRELTSLAEVVRGQQQRLEFLEVALSRKAVH